MESWGFRNGSYNVHNRDKREYQSVLFAKPVSTVTKRNERERNRVRLLNEGFSCLREKIPFAVYGKKRLSKVETLRHAVDYIKNLQWMIQEYDKQFRRESRDIRMHKDGRALNEPQSNLDKDKVH